MKSLRHLAQQAPLRSRPRACPFTSKHRRTQHPRPAHQPRPAASAQASTEPSTYDDDAIEQLKAWIHSHGGYIYPDLVVEPRARCGTRGVVARAPISLDVISSQPLVLVPERLYMTTVAAKDKFNTMPGVFIGDLDPAMQLAIMLAAERARGAASFWHPYIATLPERPPCAWCMTGAEVAATCGALQRCMPGLELPKEVQRVRKQVQMECEIVATAFGKQLGITALDLFWAKGQVMSRCFGTGDELALAPYIDLINHEDGAGSPAAVEVHGQMMVYVSSSAGLMGLPLDAGDELYIDYVSDCAPLMAYLSFGFVPPSLLQ